MGIINNTNIRIKLLLAVLSGPVVFVIAIIAGQFMEGGAYIAIVGVITLLWLILAAACALSIIKSLDRISQGVKSLAQGAHSVNFNRGQEGELGLLEDSLAEAADSIKGLKDQIDSLTRQEESNEAEAPHILRALAALDEGNFSVNIPAFTGIWGQISTSINSLGGSLQNLNKDLKELIESATVGKLDKRVDTSIYQGDWVHFAESLNSLLDAVSAPIHEAIEVMDQVSCGNFSREINGNYHGDFSRIKESINGTISNTSHYIGEITRILTDLANKNLSVEVYGDFVGDFSAIKNALGMIISQFNEVMHGIDTAAEQVAVGAKTISDSSMSLAEGANMQAVTVDDLTITITQVDEKTASNAENAARAEQLSTQSQENAAKGNTEMQNMLVAMEGIKESSSNISTIIRVISDIAFQTSMLALNAAVEAARAGEHGKGFAVVAEEVRNLALRSDEAAKETTSLIEESIEKVNQGTAIAVNTAQALEKIVSDTDEVSNIISGIAAESHQQSEAISQVNSGTGRIAEVIQRNSSTSEETAAAAQELSSQSEVLRDMIAVFKLRGGRAGSRTGSKTGLGTSGIYGTSGISSSIQTSKPKPVDTVIKQEPKYTPAPVVKDEPKYTPAPVIKDGAKKDEPKPETELDTAADTTTDLATDLEETKTDIKSDIKSDIESGQISKPESDSKPELKTESKPDQASDAVVKPKTEIKPASTTATKPKTEIKPASTTATKPLEKPITKPITKPASTEKDLTNISDDMAANYVAESREMERTKAKEAKLEAKEGTKLEAKEGAKLEAKEDAKEEAKEIAKEGTKLEAKEDAKEIAKEGTKLEAKEKTKTEVKPVVKPTIPSKIETKPSTPPKPPTTTLKPEAAPKPAVDKNPLPDFSQGMANSNPTTVKAPSASHIYGKSDFGKY